MNPFQQAVIWLLLCIVRQTADWHTYQCAALKTKRILGEDWDDRACEGQAWEPEARKLTGDLR